jgi:hypothetical protein
MAKIIDADVLLKKLDEPIAITSQPQLDRVHRLANDLMRSMVERCESIDTAPTVHGHWNVFVPEKDVVPTLTPSYYCSVCGNNAAFVVDGLEPIPPVLFKRLIYKYCPHCGAMMDEEVPDETS